MHPLKWVGFSRAQRFVSVTWQIVIAPSYQVWASEAHLTPLVRWRRVAGSSRISCYGWWNPRAFLAAQEWLRLSPHTSAAHELLADARLSAFSLPPCRTHRCFLMGSHNPASSATVNHHQSLSSSPMDQIHSHPSPECIVNHLQTSSAVVNHRQLSSFIGIYQQTFIPTSLSSLLDHIVSIKHHQASAIIRSRRYIHHLLIVASSQGSRQHGSLSQTTQILTINHHAPPTFSPVSSPPHTTTTLVTELYEKTTRLLIINHHYHP